MDPDLDCSNKSNLGLHCLAMRLLKHLSRRQKQTIFVVISTLTVISQMGNHILKNIKNML